MFDDNEILDKITGRNGFNPNEPKPPHFTCREVTRTMTTKAQPTNQGLVKTDTPVHMSLHEKYEAVGLQLRHL